MSGLGRKIKRGLGVVYSDWGMEDNCGGHRLGACAYDGHMLSCPFQALVIVTQNPYIFSYLPGCM